MVILPHPKQMTISFGNQYSIQLSYERVEAVHYNGFKCIPPAPFMPKNVIVCNMHFTNPSPQQICQMMRSIHNIAVVGLSAKQDRPSFHVAKAMQGLGYRIIPVRPMVSEVLGETAYPDLSSVPQHIDLVDVFRAPEHVPAIVDSCIERGVKYLWLQDGVINEEAALRAQAAGIIVVMDRCIWRDGGIPCGNRDA
jgi:predicted CoA-binding protein